MFIHSIGREGPVLLIYDGHASHIDIQVIKLVIKNSIHLLRSPSHTTHLLQPLDVGVYGPIRMAWVKILVEFSYSHIGRALTKEGFLALLKQICLRGFTEVMSLLVSRQLVLYPSIPVVLMQKAMRRHQP